MTDTLRSRSEIVNQWYGALAAAGPPPPVAAAPPAPAKASPTADEPFEPQPYHADPDETVECPKCSKMNDVDASYCDQCGFELKGASGVTIGGKPAGNDYQPVPYHQDPDENVQCPKCQKMNDVDASYCDQCGTKLAGDPDVKIIAPAAPPAPATSTVRGVTYAQNGYAIPPPPEPAAAPAPPPATKAPTTDVDNSVPCANTQSDGTPCNHLASAHDDTATGANTGPCSMQNCDCAGMMIPDQDEDLEAPEPAAVPAGAASAETSEWEVRSTEARGRGTVPPNLARLLDRATEGNRSAPLTAAAPPVAPAPEAAPSAPALPGPADLPPLDALGPAFSIPVAVTEGTLTDDGRTIAPNALTWRDPPIPLMYLKHTPEMGGHGGAKLVGRINTITRGGTVISMEGNFLTTPDGAEAAADLGGMGRLGISIDVGNVSEDIELPPIEGDEEFDGPVASDPVASLTAGVIMAATMCTQAAFPGAYIVLGDGSAPNAAIPLEQPSAGMGIEGIHVLSGQPCCDDCEETDALVAAGAIAPIRPPTAWFVVDEPTELTPLRVTEAGQVYGHIPWNQCHTGFTDRCVVAPRGGAFGYDRFLSGYVLTEEGDEIRTGPITSGTTHGDDARDWNDWSIERTKRHYADTGHAVADVAVRDGKLGIWMCGAMRPTATDEDFRMMRASVVSPDWRWEGNHQSMVAALAVNYGGFPTPRIPRMKAVVASGHTKVLVASGVTEQLVLRAEEEQAEPTADQLVWRVMAPIVTSTLRARMNRVRSL